MYFPKLTRRNETDYHVPGTANFYANYQEYREKVSEDCQHRCVYCDITSDENGGEGMQLDHFRPQNYFFALKSHPHNLYLACAKCNRLKTNDWPCGKNIGDPSFVGAIGYIDRFEHDPMQYLFVNDDGGIVQIDGPINYMIRKLSLNRLSRTQIRRRRIINKRKEVLSVNITKLMEKLLSDMREDRCEKSIYVEKLGEILALKRSLDSL